MEINSKFNYKSSDTWSPRNALMGWKVSDIHNKSLLRSYLREIPITYNDYDHYFAHILEEFRAKLSADIRKDLDTYRTGYVVPLSINNNHILIEINNIQNEFSHQSTISAPILIVQANAAAGISNDIIQDSEHFFCIVSRKVADMQDFTNLLPQNHDLVYDITKRYLLVEFFAKGDIDHLTAQTLFLGNIGRNNSSNWIAIIIDTPIFISNRIYDAIYRENICCEEIMHCIYTGQSFASNRNYVSNDLVELAMSVSSTNNESQRDAILAILAAKSPITIIHGPPGTGKTSTLIPVIQGLLVQGKRIHVTAPTNQAVCELARRLVKCISETQSREYSHIVLVGSASTRKERLLNVCKLWDNDFAMFKQTILRKSILLGHFNESSLTSKNNINLNEYVLKELSTRFEVLRQHSEVVFSEWPRSSFPLLWSNKFKSLSKDFASYLQVLNDLNVSEIINWFSTESASQDFPISDVFARLESVLLSGIPLTGLNPSTLETEIFESASVVFSTVNVSGKRIFRAQSTHFDVLMIDEATQLSEAETMIAFNKHIKCLILAGDHKQLPSTVISEASKRMGYGRSLFERLVVHHQYPAYRMHPRISAWPSYTFYNN